MEGNRTALPEQLKNAVIVVAMIPVLCIYPFVQKYFVKGVMLGSVKG
jgi:putative aldouronate transport system permease protein